MDQCKAKLYTLFSDEKFSKTDTSLAKGLFPNYAYVQKYETLLNSNANVAKSCDLAQSASDKKRFKQLKAAKANENKKRQEDDKRKRNEDARGGPEGSESEEDQPAAKAPAEKKYKAAKKSLNKK